MSRRKIAVGSLIVVVLAAAGGYVAFNRADGKSGSHGNGDRADGRPTVRTVRPRLDPTFRISNQQIAVVEPFYQAALRARASGLVRAVPFEIGERVWAGDLLVEIDAPDLEQDVAQKEAVIRQREQELRVSKAMLRHAGAAVETAGAAVAQRTAEAKAAVATRDFKYKLFSRLRRLQDQGAIRPEVVDENERDYQAAEAAVEAAQVAIQKAKADRTEKLASLEAAAADVELKAALVAVAGKDRDRAAATAGFARVVAPFDGVVVRRNVDPGVFVQNATTGASEPLVTVARTDLVTVAMKLPDTAAPFVGRDTDVEVTFDDLPGLTVRGKVTRFAPVIDGSDRTLRVELDIYNGTPSDYRSFQAAALAGAAAPLAGGTGLGSAGAFLAAEAQRQMCTKGLSDRAPVCLGPSGAGPLVPGMTASMKVFLDRVATAHLLPASAAYVRGGKTYVLLVRDGVTVEVPVRVQVNDGRMVKVGLLGGPVAGLTGAEEVVVSRQLEVGDGARVKTSLGDW